MSYYWFNKRELLQKSKEKYDNGGKEKAAKYYQANLDALKEKARDKYKTLSEEKKKKSTARAGIKKCEKIANLFLQYKNE